MTQARSAAPMVSVPPRGLFVLEFPRVRYLPYYSEKISIVLAPLFDEVDKQQDAQSTR